MTDVVPAGWAGERASHGRPRCPLRAVALISPLMVSDGWALWGRTDGRSLMRSFGLRRRPEGEGETIAIYYASDVHGSELCWRKFLTASKHYRAPLIIMGGDLTGKAIVPIVEKADGSYVGRLLGEDRLARGKAELDELMTAVRYNGMYPWVASRQEIDATETDDVVRDELFDQVILDELRRWLVIADERIETQPGLEVFVMAGNDDPWACDDVIRSARHVSVCDDRVVQVGPHEMISLSIANPTPWNSPRELDESALYDRLKALAEQVQEPGTAIFNLHVPPYDSGLDRANEIAADLTVVYKSGHPNVIPVGSTAVRQIIEEYQPLLSLHGHIHESRAEAQIGRTLAINSGSEYNSGRIHGVVVKLGRHDVVSRQFVVG